ncbi:hypothetical protein BFW01_g1859 [Lasiodiplodia theobromae]|uniref:Secreted protein n=1 Tax=Lasiodiplodia theobromae TaxID=45133 RepID=A0A8H7ISW3_9PEZI|nr:hypothetical protein BFW01_g1859 [Lasiodiplodia theobromae]
MRELIVTAAGFLATFPLVTASNAVDIFKSPPLEYRPKFRYWLPDASASVDAVKRDVAAVAEIGGGGLELIPFYNYGCAVCTPDVLPEDWSTYAFGTEPLHNIYRGALEASRDHGVLLDFAQGGNQGQGVPAEPQTTGLAKHMAYSNVTVKAGTTFNGTLPLSTQPLDQSGGGRHQMEDWGEQKLFAVLAAEVLEDTNRVVLGEPLDLTQDVSDGRTLSWTPPAGNSTWRIFAWYERYTNQRSVAAGQTITNFIHNGSWIVDHFSAEGAKLMTNFFDEYVIRDDETAQLLASAGRYAWEDSHEMDSCVWWTEGMDEMFLKRNNYNIAKCLPFLVIKGNGWAGQEVPYGEEFVASNSTFQSTCNGDFRATLNDGYRSYLAGRMSWAHSHGIKFSTQVGYNVPVDVLSDIHLVDVPEGESYGWKDNPDLYRQYSGPAHLADISVVSSEAGAVVGNPYGSSVNDLLFTVRRGLATGINMNVLHGFPYSGPYKNTTWPNCTPFNFYLKEMWSPNLPSWTHLTETMQYISRNQYISQAGTPKLDLAFYKYTIPWSDATGYKNSNLETVGYTYDYLGLENLQNASVSDRVLAPQGPAYQALIFSNATQISNEAASKLKEFAEAGLPVFFVGNATFTGILSADAAAASIMADIISSGLENVFNVGSANELPAALSKAAIRPRAALSNGTAPWYSFWREQDDLTHVFLYNDGPDTQTLRVDFAITNSTPYTFDAWTGAVAPILHYTTTPTHTTIPITLAANQTTIIGFAKPGAAATNNLTTPHTHATSTSGALANLLYDATDGGHLLAQLSGPTASVTLANGTRVDLTAAGPLAPSNLTSWNLTIADWQPSAADPASMASIVTNHTYTDVPPGSWLALDPATLTNVSGTGRYVTTFFTPASSSEQPSSLGAILHLGPVQHTLRATLNGRALPAVDVADAVVDISGFLSEEGEENELVVEVSTNLFNRVRAEAGWLGTSGATADGATGGAYGNAAPQGYGLLGPVWVEWVEVVRVV